MRRSLEGLRATRELSAAVFILVMLGVDVVLVAAACFLCRGWLERLLTVASATTGLLVVDLVTGARLQINTILGYSPVVGGRFAGIGNLGFAVLAAATLLAATLIVHLGGRSLVIVAGVSLLFASVAVVDGAPWFGSDVGGTLADGSPLSVQSREGGRYTGSTRIVIRPGGGVRVIHD